MKIDETDHQIAIVVPCFNEAQRLNLDYWNYILHNNDSILWIFADDGSTDDTPGVLEKLTHNPNCLIIKNSVNLGKGETIRNAWNSIFLNGNSILGLGFLDADGAFDKDEIELIISKFRKIITEDRFNVVSTSRVALSGRQILRHKSRHYLGRLLATYMTHDWLDSPYDTQCGFKMFKYTPEFRNAIYKPFLSRWLFDIELFMRLYGDSTLKVWEEPLNYWKDIDGSKMTFGRMIKTLPEILIVRKLVKFSMNNPNKD